MLAMESNDTIIEIEKRPEPVVLEAENVVAIEDDGEEENFGEENGPIRRNRRKMSHVWKHFVVISLPSGVRKDKCNHCKKSLLINPLVRLYT